MLHHADAAGRRGAPAYLLSLGLISGFSGALIRGGGKGGKGVTEHPPPHTHTQLRSSLVCHSQFGQLILKKVIKIVATRCHILRQYAPDSISVEALPQT